MRKIIAGIFILFAFTLVACTEITDDVEKAQKPSIELKSEGELIQIHEENEVLENVTFEVIFNKFEENNIIEEEVTINWYIRGELIDSYTNLKTITQIVRNPGDITIRVEVIYTLEEKEFKLEADSLIRVIKTPTSIIVTNSADAETHRVSVTLDKDNRINFTGTITGNLKHSTIKWVIQRQTSTEPVLLEEIIVSDLVVNNNVGTAKLSYLFDEIGSYIVTLQTGSGVTEDSNKYISNTTHINVGFGEFIITNNNNKAESVETGLKDRLLTIRPLDTELVGEGTYDWYLNGNKLDHQGLEYTHTYKDIGSYSYEVLFTPNNNDIPIIKTNPLLVVNGVEVATEDELLTELENKTKGIILMNDILYSHKSKSLNLNYPVTIYGNGYVLSSNEIEVFMSITSNDVILSNLTITIAGRYNLHISNSDNIYLEDIKMDEIGGGVDTNAFLNGEFGAGVYINKSEVTINNIEFLQGGLVGIRIDNDSNGVSKLAKLDLIGNFVYNMDDPLLLPIGSGKSSATGVEVNAEGFDYFALPAGEITIRRWDNQGEPVGWKLMPQEKLVYNVGDFLDLNGIGISVEIGFLGLDISDAQGLVFVKLFISMFNQYGKLEIINDEKEIVQTYYIVGDTGSNKVYGDDKLVYSLTKDLDITNQVRPDLPETPGTYYLRIFIGDEFELGSIKITVE